jgi:MFS family permease
MFPTSAASLVAEVSPLPRRAEGLSFFGMAGGLAQIATPALGVAIVELWGFDAVFVLAAATAALTLLIVQPVTEPAVHAPAADAGAGALIPRAALFPTLVLLTVGFSFTAAATFLPLLGDERDLGNVGLFFLVAGAANIVTRPIAGRVADRVGRSAAIVPGLVASVGSMWLLAVAFAPPTLWAAGLLLGVGVGAAHTGLFALTVDRVTAGERGRATAVFQLAWDISALVGGLVLGVVASGLDVAAVYWITGVVVVVGLVILMAGPHQRPAAVPDQP